MIAFGPDFKRGFVDRAPASNADIPLTLARILGLALPSRGKLRGRVLAEALAGGPADDALDLRRGGFDARPRMGSGRRSTFRRRCGVRYLDAAKKVSGPSRLGRLGRRPPVQPACARSDGHETLNGAALTARSRRPPPVRRRAPRRASSGALKSSPRLESKF